MERDLLEKEMFKEVSQTSSEQPETQVPKEAEASEKINERVVLEWEAPEFTYYPKDTFWYSIAGLVTALGALNAYLLNNLLFATLILLSGIVVIFSAGKKPLTIPYRIDWRGITIGDTNHRFYEYESFWIEEKKNGNILLLSPNKTFGQQTIIPLGNTDLFTVQKYLLNHLPEVPDQEPLSHKAMEYLGF